MADEHKITLEAAKPLTAAYRASACYRTYNNRKAVAFSKDAILRLINQSGSEGIRCYFAHDENNMLTLLLAAYDAEANDILTELAEMGQPCPGACSSANDLNG